MNSKNYNIKRKKRVRKKPLRIAVFAVLFIGIAVTVYNILSLFQKRSMRKVFLI